VLECTGNSRGVAVGYDEGIDPGSEWPDDIGPLDRCAFSPRPVESKNVRNEINDALNADKAFLAHRARADGAAVKRRPPPSTPERPAPDARKGPMRYTASYLQGFRGSRASHLSASASPTNFSFAGSQDRARPSRIAMTPRWQTTTDRWP